MQICAFHADYLSDAVALFIQGYQQQRLATPLLPDAMADTGRVTAKLERLFHERQGAVALERGRLAGYLGWVAVDRFRGTKRRAAYVPEWGHACVAEGRAEIYRALYGSAAEHWDRAACQVHAVTLLAHDRAAAQAWFWNGFGLTVVDAIRSLLPLEVAPPAALAIRPAVPEDAVALAELDADHWASYTRPPISMPARPGRDAADHVAFLSRPNNRIWLALDGATPVGFMRFDAYDFDGVAIVESEVAIAITGAYIRPAYRGRRAAAALLDAGLRDYQARGLRYCAVNFESFNPAATAFWMKYFKPVCLSVVRVPESVAS